MNKASIYFVRTMLRELDKNLEAYLKQYSEAELENVRLKSLIQLTLRHIERLGVELSPSLRKELEATLN